MPSHEYLSKDQYRTYKVSLVYSADKKTGTVTVTKNGVRIFQREEPSSRAKSLFLLTDKQLRRNPNLYNNADRRGS